MDLQRLMNGHRLQSAAAPFKETAQRVEKEYADIETVNGVTIIRYIDGYFDSL